MERENEPSSELAAGGMAKTEDSPRRVVTCEAHLTFLCESGGRILRLRILAPEH